jgi:hypothetical protein
MACLGIHSHRAKPSEVKALEAVVGRSVPMARRYCSEEDRILLLEWCGREDIMSMSCVLGRAPWGLQREVCKLRKLGVFMEYRQIDKVSLDAHVTAMRDDNGPASARPFVFV